MIVLLLQSWPPLVASRCSGCTMGCTVYVERFARLHSIRMPLLSRICALRASLARRSPLTTLQLGTPLLVRRCSPEVEACIAVLLQIDGARTLLYAESYGLVRIAPCPSGHRTRAVRLAVHVCSRGSGSSTCRHRELLLILHYISGDIHEHTHQRQTSLPYASKRASGEAARQSLSPRAVGVMR